MCHCDNLPGFFNIPPITDWEHLEQTAYQFFITDVIDRIICFKDKRVFGSPCKYEDCHQQSFEHIITRTDNEGNRVPDYDRLRRITWIRPLITLNCDCVYYKVWSALHERSKAYRWFIWCTQENYVIILEEQKKSYILITAYLVDEERTKKKFLKAYEKYQRQQNGSAPQALREFPT